MSNPYQPLFQKLDATVEALGDVEAIHAPDKDAITDAVDLLRRMGYVLAAHINNQAHYLQMLILDPEPVTKDELTDKIGPNPLDHTEGTSLTDTEEG